MYFNPALKLVSSPYTKWGGSVNRGWGVLLLLRRAVESQSADPVAALATYVVGSEWWATRKCLNSLLREENWIPWHLSHVNWGVTALSATAVSDMYPGYYVTN